MGCLFACFTACNHKRHRHLVHISPSKHQGEVAEESMQPGEETLKLHVPDEPIKPPAALKKEKLEEQSRCNLQKKVTFDLDAKDEAADGAVKNHEDKKSETVEETANETKTAASTLTSYLPNHRYQNCTTGEERKELEFDNGDLDAKSDEDGHGDGQHLVQAESSESLFSLSIDSRKQMAGAELGEKEVTSPLPKCDSRDEEHSNADRNLCVIDSVLNPVENTIQWESVKKIPNLPLQQHQDKENIMVGLEAAVDTSLSSWLATPVSNRSVSSVENSESAITSHDDRSILGALTVVELKENYFASTRVRRATSRSSDETAIVGTVGRYWIHTGQNTPQSFVQSQII